jgi:hypothetical protein
MWADEGLGNLWSFLANGRLHSRAVTGLARGSQHESPLGYSGPTFIPISEFNDPARRKRAF